MDVEVVAYHPASIESICLLEWRREKKALPESRQTFQATKAQISGLDNLVFSRQTVFFECEHPLIDKTIVLTEPTVARAQLLESFIFRDEDNYEYEIFTILSISHAWTNVILAEKRDSRRHSTTSFSENVIVAGTSYQM